MASVVVKVSGMKCGGCVKSVTNVLQELPGVNRVEVLLKPGEARVDYDPGKVQVEAMKQAGEVDLWGRIRRVSESASANALATDEARRGVILSLVASVAGNYLTLRGLDEQLAVSKSTLAAYGESLRLYQLQFQYGQVSQMQVSQVQSQYETAAVQIPQIESQIAQTENAINVLLGRNPGPVPRGKSVHELALPKVPAGMTPKQLVEAYYNNVISGKYEEAFKLLPFGSQMGYGGVLKQSPTLDHVGVFARSVEDVAMLARELYSWDGKDLDVAPGSVLELPERWEQALPGPPRIAFVKTPLWPQAERIAQEAFVQLAENWSDVVTEVDLPPAFDSALEWHRTIMEADLANSFEDEYARGRDRLSDVLVQMTERGQRYTGVSFSKARDGIVVLQRARAAVRRVRRDPHAGHAGRGAAGTRRNGQ